MKISIITINYNNADGLNATINSVLSQTYKNIEYIIIDGGSEDESKNIILKNEEGIAYWVSENDRGIYHAMNKGIEIASGEYLLFLNSGDILDNDNVIEKAFESGFSSDIIYGNLLLLEENSTYLWELPDILTFGHFYFQGLPHPATFIKKDLFDKIGLYDETFKIVSDWKFFILAICKFNYTYKHVNFTISQFNNRGVSSDPSNLIIINKEKEETLNEYFKAFLLEYDELSKARKQLQGLKPLIKINKFLGLIKIK